MVHDHYANVSIARPIRCYVWYNFRCRSTDPTEAVPRVVVLGLSQSAGETAAFEGAGTELSRENYVRICHGHTPCKVLCVYLTMPSTYSKSSTLSKFSATIVTGVWPNKKSGQGATRTRGLCLAKAAIYRADLLAQLGKSVIEPKDINLSQVRKQTAASRMVRRMRHRHI